MGLNDAVQALKKADILKEKVDSCRDLLNDGEAWIWQQQLQRIYQQVLLQDLEYALDCKVEQDLWNYGFKNYIGILQNMVKDKKNPKRTESQAMLTWCLEAASGFYLTLLQEICTAFDLDLSCRRRDSVFGISDNYNIAPNRLVHPNTTSCSYICQHCLVHLGDIARYRNQNRQAESFYRHAVQLSPHSGQPYNQLALLDSSRGDRLGTVFHYVRSVAVKHPFPAAATNLKRMFGRFSEDQLALDGRNKLSVQEYVALFLKFHGLLYLRADLTTCGLLCTIRLLTDTLTAQVATESFTSRKLVQMLSVNLYAFHRACGNIFPDENDKHWDKQDHLDLSQSADQKQAKNLILDLMAGSLSALLLPVYTIRENEALLEYFALPAIKLTLDWIRLEPHVLNDQAFTSRLQIWPSLCKLLNGLQELLDSTDQSNKFSSIPLPEDIELYGFLPLSKAMQDLRFNCEDSKADSLELNRFRAARLVHFGIWLSKQEIAVISSREILCSDGVTSSTWTFEAIESGQAPSSELIRELEQLSLGVGQSPEQPSPSPSDAGSWGGSSASTPGGAISPPPIPPVILEQVLQVPEKRTGILKPQGSLEKSRERDLVETEDTSGLTVGSGRRGPRQNVAMQAILRKGVTLAPENDVKQVSFKTPSPTAFDRSDPWIGQKVGSSAKPSQTLALMSHQSQPSMPLSEASQHSTNLCQPPRQPQRQPPPPLQQLQQQAQARVVHVPPPHPPPGPVPPMFPPPLSVPPPCIKPNGMEVPGHSFVAAGCAMQVYSPYSMWQEETKMSSLVSESNHRNPWWPELTKQVPPQSKNSRAQTQNLPMNVYDDGTSNWALGHSIFNQHNRQQHQYNPHQLAHSTIQPHQATHMQQQSSNLNFLSAAPHQQLHSSQTDLRQKVFSFHKEKCSDSPGNLQGFSPYSLFSANSWLSPAISQGRGVEDANAKEGTESAVRDDFDQNCENSTAIMGAQSLWSGPGPSPLERLLEQQKQLREGPSPKSGT